MKGNTIKEDEYKNQTQLLSNHIRHCNITEEQGEIILEKNIPQVSYVHTKKRTCTVDAIEFGNDFIDNWSRRQVSFKMVKHQRI